MSGARAIVFDVDGTLYAAGPLRLRVAGQLARRYALQPGRLWRVARALQAWRRALEDLRMDEGLLRLPEDQYERAAQSGKLSEEELRAVVGEWFECVPLALLRGAARPGLREFLAAARARGVRLAALSDYPPGAKLEALGVEDLFEVVASAYDAGVQSFKPHPKGLQAVLSQLGVAPGDAVYVGDRPAVDGECARRAGVRFVEAPADFRRLREML